LYSLRAQAWSPPLGDIEDKVELPVAQALGPLVAQAVDHSAMAADEVELPVAQAAEQPGRLSDIQLGITFDEGTQLYSCSRFTLFKSSSHSQIRSHMLVRGCREVSGHRCPAEGSVSWLTTSYNLRRHIWRLHQPLFRHYYEFV